MEELITDPADPRLADYLGLTDAVRRTRHEPEEGFFIAEGVPVMQRAAQAGYALRSVLLADNRPLPERLPEAPVYRATYDVLHAVTGFHVHRGALASFSRQPLPSAADLLAEATRVVVLESVNNATNLGAIFRSTAGLGIDAVLLSQDCCDPLYRRAVRVSMGEVLALPYAYLDWPEGLADLRTAGFRVLALTPAADATRLEEVVLADDERVALLLGAEGPGLSADALAGSDLRVRIPMARGVDSLNVASAAAVACWVVGRRPV
ncbi:MAG TPA: RNA methyltransferase [Mycobacteriales bacterium]|nr:RNA methyltransferase [Mycobacteriales bacterium]